MHRLVILEPGHFHAALALRERHPRVDDEVTVYAAEAPGPGPGGREVGEFCDLLEASTRGRSAPRSGACSCVRARSRSGGCWPSGRATS
jgi:hypothetical protein